jgi:F420-0:gamma-glutamyl ligase
MVVTAIKSPIVTPGRFELINLLDSLIKNLENGSVLAVSSKLLALCDENSVYETSKITKDELIKNQADFYIPRQISVYNSKITITKNTLMLAAGIDESNVGGKLLAWPTDPLGVAKDIYSHFAKKFNLTDFGVIITDSTSRPLRLGTIGTALAHVGFNELNDYRGSKDLFGKTMDVSRTNVTENLACAATIAMGEGTEQTPLAIITDVAFVQFNKDQSSSCYYKNINDIKKDVFYPLIKNAPWHDVKTDTPADFFKD